MNERIRELADEAFVTVTSDGYFSSGEFRDKFAELIVREMLVTCVEHPTWTGRMIGNQIKEHFGVGK